MKQSLFLVVVSFINFLHCQDLFEEAKLKGDAEDRRVLNETIARYGRPEDIKLELPGPEILLDKKKNDLNNLFNGDPANYTLRIRRITSTFSYNARYEEGVINDEPVAKGLFSEHFQRDAGGFYIRTIGYTLDGKGYRQFLIDLSTAIPNMRTRISSTVLGSLIGGNSIG